MAVYLEGRDDAAGADDDEDRMLPAMEPGDRVDLVRVRPLEGHEHGWGTGVLVLDRWQVRGPVDLDRLAPGLCCGIQGLL
jgi:hypothetical protein